jgi:beta-mannosidase
VLDHRGEPKVAYRYLRRALAPIAVWMTDEGVNGLAVHVVNDGPATLRTRLRIALYRDLEVCVAEVEEVVELAPHRTIRLTVEGLLGRFVDVAWAYRFGPPAQDVIVATLSSDREPAELHSQAFRFPAGLPTSQEPSSQLGLTATAHSGNGGHLITVRSTRLAYGVRIEAPGFAAADNAFSVEPGYERVIRLQPTDSADHLQGVIVTALNARDAVRVEAG